MRWFVEISTLGQGPSPSSTVCVEAPQWQPALQKARALRGDEGAFANFSIELLDDGFRAIDPGARLKYVVRRAPDDAKVTDKLPDSIKVNGASSPPPAAKSTPPPANDKPAAQPVKVESRSKTPYGGVRVDGSAEEAKAKPKIAIPLDVPPRPTPAPPPVAFKASDTIQDSLPSFETIRERSDAPSAKSPLYYREVAYAVAPGTSEAAAGRLVVERFEAIKVELAKHRSGKLVNLAVFDHRFTAKPLKRPLVTLTWKDWKGEEPEVRYPQREGGGDTPTPLAQVVAPKPQTIPSTPPAPPKPILTDATVRSSAPPAASPPIAAASPPIAAASPPVAAASPPIAAASPPIAPSSPPIAAASPPVAPSSPPIAAASPPVGSAPPPAAVASAPPPAPISAPPPTTPVHSTSAPPTDPSPRPEMETDESIEVSVEVPIEVVTATPEPVQPAVSAITPSHLQPMPREPEPAPEPPRAPSTKPSPEPPQSKRLSGDDLLVELFEACSNLHFLPDTLAGAEFVLALTLEKLPSEIGLVSLFDINKREFVVVRQSGGRSILTHRTPEKSQIVAQAMRSSRSVVVADTSSDARVASDERWEHIGAKPRSLICAPALLGGRYLGAIEIANPLDGKAYTDGDGHALTYIGQQFGEFVAERGVIVDAEAIREKAAQLQPKRR